MYHALLANRYLTSRLIPLVAVAAVALCVALVIIVVSVMTGFLDMVKESGRKLMGDVVITRPLTGLPRYERLLELVEAAPGAAAATPVVDGWALLRMPYPVGDTKDVAYVQFWAVEPESFEAVTGFGDTLWWQPPAADERDEILAEDARIVAEYEAALERWRDRFEAADDATRERLLREQPELDRDHRAILIERRGEEGLETLAEQGRSLSVAGDEEGERLPAIVLGAYVSEANQRRRDGTIRVVNPRLWFMPDNEIEMTTIPVRGGLSSPQPKRKRLRIANEFVSGVFLIDDTRVIVPLEVGQELTSLEETEIVDEETFEVVGIAPARATMVLIRAADGVTPEALAAQVREAYATYAAELAADDTLSFDDRNVALGVGGASVQTWMEQQARFIEPVENERELMRLLFSIVYLVCAGLVLSIFWAIVYEKTRDIGILRSVGASRTGIGLIFVRYGLVIGTLGGLVGVGIAYGVIRNVNAIHAALGDPPLWVAWTLGVAALATAVVAAIRARSGRMLPIVLGATVTLALAGAAAAIVIVDQRGGFLLWNPEVYYFTRIPDRMDWFTAWTTVVGAMVFSVLGAFFPAAKAADTDPVQALRYE